MQAGFEELLIMLVMEVVEQIICACQWILSTVPKTLGYRDAVICMELNMNILLVALEMMMPLVLFAMFPLVRLN